MSSWPHASRISAINAVIGRSWLWFTASASLAALAAPFSQHGPLLYAGVVVMTVVESVCVLASLRFYNPWLSWSVWLIPFAPFFAIVEPIRIGAISVISLAFFYLLSAAIMFGGFAVARDRLRSWLQVHGAF